MSMTRLLQQVNIAVVKRENDTIKDFLFVLCATAAGQTQESTLSTLHFHSLKYL